MEKLKPCPFCGGEAKLSFKDVEFYGMNCYGDKKIKYRVQVICNKCHSRGKPVKTDWLINPRPWNSLWANCKSRHNPATDIVIKQTEMVRPWVERAIEAWNRRADNDRG